ncbi:MAG: DoxX family protein [Nitrosopumilaceae archaeon]
MNEILENVKKLLKLDVGDRGRLEYILETLSNGKELFTSDKNYLENLIEKHIETSKISKNSNDTEVLELKAKIRELEANCECNTKMQMATSLFGPSRLKIADLGILFARIGISFSFLWAGYGKVSDPNGFGQMLQGMMGIVPEIAPMMSSVIGSLELIAGIFFILGVLIRPASIFAIIILIGSMVMFGLDFGSGPAIWKDPSILGLAILLVLYGSGKFGIDGKINSLISKRMKGVNY